MAQRVPTIDSAGALTGATLRWVEVTARRIAQEEGTTPEKVMAAIGIELMPTGSGYSLVLRDTAGRLSEMAIDESGRFPQWVLDRWAERMALLQKVSTGLGITAMDPGSGYSLAVLDAQKRIAELALDESGQVPQWIIDRWYSRMPKPQASGGRRDALVAAFKARRGGRIGTAGRPVIALRFDHGLTPFQAKILPLLRERGLPSMNTMNSRTWGESTNNGMSHAQAQSAWINDGCEFTNHGALHGDNATPEQYPDIIVNGQKELQEQFPESVVEGYSPAGTIGTQALGFNTGAVTAQWSDTEAGRLASEHHAALFGYSTGAYRPQTMLEIGASHATIDSQSLAWIKGVIRGAVDARAALTLMFHPVFLDVAGYLSTSDFTAVLDDLVARRDAGEILVTTATGSLVLDPSSGWRHDLVPGGWGVSLAAGASASRQVWNSRLKSLRGGMRDIEVTGTGSYTVAVTDSSGALNVTRARSGASHTPFQIPVSATNVTVTVTATTAVSLSIMIPAI